jgi:hypothetical protein
LYIFVQEICKLVIKSERPNQRDVQENDA